ncbi:hypothetical protein BDW75DRAFT_229573 [Aspergillus navahoensis]
MGRPETDDIQRPVSHQPSPKTKRHTRSRIACDWCHFNHARCDQTFPCSRCLDKGTPWTARIEGINSPLHTISPSSEAQSIGSSAVHNVQTPEHLHQDSLYAHDGAVILSPGDIGDLSPIESLPWSMQEAETKPPAVGEMPWTQRTVLDEGPLPLDLVDGAGLTDRDSFILANLAAGPPIPASDLMTPLRYPVLQPLMPSINAELSTDLACGLLELYFTSAFPTHMHPVCHSIPCYVLRKASFLSETNYRPRSPALLASMLWVASSDDHALASPITTHCRKKTSRFLRSLTMELLRSSAQPSLGTSGHAAASETICSAAGLEPFLDFALSTPPASDSTKDFEFPGGSLDDVIAYIHIASIPPPDDQNALAFTLARELHLNREIEAIPRMDSQGVCSPYDPAVSTPQPLDCICHRRHEPTILVTEEQREERRRVWWLLYIMDRHLALCRSRPLMLLDSESKDLLLPLDDEAWQAGEIHSNGPNSNGPQCLPSGTTAVRRVFPDFTCHDPSLFGFFLPLMTILGQLLDINQARNHPMLGLDVLGEELWEAQLHEVLDRLDQYEASLHSFTASVHGRQALSSADHDPAQCSTARERFWLSQTVTAYASYCVDVLHILQDGKWDPRSLAGDQTLWTSSLNLVSAIPHALKAAESVKRILHFDPNLSFMPTFFSAQLLQGGFYFLLILDQLQDQAGDAFLSACDAMIRATESWTVTLDSGYLKRFCLVMRSALAQARGRPITQYEVQQRRRAMLALHVWPGTGTGPIA